LDFFKKNKNRKRKGKVAPVNGAQAEAGQSPSLRLSTRALALPWPMLTAWQPATSSEGRWRTDRPCSDRTFKPV
jgi:hypothetical protein